MVSTADTMRATALTRAMVFIGVGLLSLACGLIGLDRKSLWFDEAQSIDVATRSWTGMFHVARGHEAAHLFYDASLKPWLAVVGTSEVAARVPSVVASSLAAVALAWLGTLLFDLWVGAIAGVLLASNTFVVLWSQQARSYAFALLAAILSTVCFVRALECASTRRLLLYAASTIAAAWMNAFAIAVCLGQIPGAILGHARLEPRRWLIGGCCIVVALTPLLLLLREANAGQFSWLEAPTGHDVARGIGLVFGLNPFLFVAAVAGMATLIAEGSGMRWKVALLLGWAIGPFALTLALSIVRPAFDSRYLLVATAPIALLAAAALGPLTRLRPRSGTVVLALVLAANGVALYGWYSGPAVEDWRGATEYVVAAHSAAEPIIVAPLWAAPAYSYYEGRAKPAARASGQSVWVVALGDDVDAQVEAGRTAVHAPRYALLARRDFGSHLSVQHWVRTALPG